MNKNIWIIIIIVLLAALLFFLLRPAGEVAAPTAELPDTGLTDEQLPEDVVNRDDELPADYVEEVLDDVGGESVQERVSAIEETLHTGNSGDLVFASFPDVEYLFDWTPDGPERRIYPFFYYYSAEADTTFAVCNINKTVAICDGLQDQPIGEGDGHCVLAEPYEANFLVE